MLVSDNDSAMLYSQLTYKPRCKRGTRIDISWATYSRLKRMMRL